MLTDNDLDLQNNIRCSFQKFKISLIRFLVQKQIVEKIEAERALVESAKKLIDIYEQKVKDAIAKLWEE